MTARMRLRRSTVRFDAAEYALSAMTVSGLRRAGPPPRRGTATCSSTAGSIGESAVCPGVISTAMPRPLPSVAMWALVLRAPRERPSL